MPAVEPRELGKGRAFPAHEYLVYPVAVHIHDFEDPAAAGEAVPFCGDAAFEERCGSDRSYPVAFISFRERFLSVSFSRAGREPFFGRERRCVFA